jgi:hypothetical protein
MINERLIKGDRYYGLDASPQFWLDLVNNPQKIKDCCNGVGSEVGWWGKLTYHLIPNTVWGLDVTEFSDIHDYDYCYPESFATKQDALNYKHLADNRGLDNILAIIDRDTKWTWLKIMRRARAMKYYDALDIFGEDSFLDGKIIGGKKYHPS